LTETYADGDEFEFVNKIKGGVIPHSFIPGIPGPIKRRTMKWRPS